MGAFLASQRFVLPVFLVISNLGSFKFHLFFLRSFSTPGHLNGDLAPREQSPRTYFVFSFFVNVSVPTPGRPQKVNIEGRSPFFVSPTHS